MTRQSNPANDMAVALAVGTSCEQHVRWLIDLASRDLTPDPAAEQAAREISWFCRAAQGTAERRGFELWGVTRRVRGELQVQVPTKETARELQRETRSCFDALRPRDPPHGMRWFELPEPPFSGIRYDAGFFPDGAGEVCPPRFVVISKPASLPAHFWAAVCVTLLGNPDLRFCLDAACGEPFLARRSDQKYCSRRCRNRVAQRAFRRERPESTEERHARHVRAVRRSLPEGLEIELGGVPVKRRGRRKEK